MNGYEFILRLVELNALWPLAVSSSIVVVANFIYRHSMKELELKQLRENNEHARRMLESGEEYE